MTFPLYVYHRDIMVDYRQRPKIEIMKDISDNAMVVVKDIQDIQIKFNDLKTVTTQDQYMKDVQSIEKDLSDLLDKGNIIYKDILELRNPV